MRLNTNHVINSDLHVYAGLICVCCDLQWLGFEICSHVPRMHDLKLLLRELTTQESSQALHDQQRHLEALWSHLSRKLKQRLSVVKRHGCNSIDAISGDVSGLNIANLEQIVAGWLKRLQEAVVKFAVMPNVLDCHQEMDIGALQLLLLVITLLLLLLLLLYLSFIYDFSIYTTHTMPT